jgi:signal transduction histidine kinase
VHDFLSSALRSLLDLVEASWIAFVPVDAAPIASGPIDVSPELESAVLADARAARRLRSVAEVPQEAGDAGHATCYTPIHLGPRRIGTLAAFRGRGEPFSQYECGAFTRLSDLIALAWATERYQQQRAIVARLHERQRIADDLHDQVAQLLYVAQIGIDSLLEAEDITETGRAELTKVRGLLVRGDASIRSVIHDLARPRAAGLRDRLENAVEMVEAEYSLPVHLRIDDEAGQAAARLTTPSVDALVKVAQEALANAAKHAGPCRVSISLRMQSRGGIRLTIADDGIGLADGARPRYGLTSLRRVMRDHGGAIRVLRGKDGGVKVSAFMPLEDLRERKLSRPKPAGK